MLNRLARSGTFCSNYFTQGSVKLFSMPSIFTFTFPLDYWGYDESIMNRPTIHPGGNFTKKGVSNGRFCPYRYWKSRRIWSWFWLIFFTMWYWTTAYIDQNFEKIKSSTGVEKFLDIQKWSLFNFLPMSIMKNTDIGNSYFKLNLWGKTSSTGFVTDLSIKWLEGHSDKPFAMYLHYNNVHEK